LLAVVLVAEFPPILSPAAVPVIFVPISTEGVPRFGVISVGLVANTTLPVPVLGAALIAVPLPCKMPVTVVDNVMTGVVVGVATVPARPLADSTDTLVTVPRSDGEANKIQVVPFHSNKLPVSAAMANCPTWPPGGKTPSVE
jgi:hypothetical protein